MPQVNVIRKNIACRLRAARMKIGLSQLHVAQHLGLQRPSVSEIEAGRRAVTAEELVCLAEIYGVSLPWIVKPKMRKTEVKLSRNITLG